jgi:acyl carrier protein phosphodiesterase
VMPDRFFGLRSMMGKYFMAENLYALNDTKRANQMIESCAAYKQKELVYLADVSASKGKFTGGQNIQLGMSFLNQMAKTTAKYNQTQLSQSLQTQYNAMEGRFSAFYAPQ